MVVVILLELKYFDVVELEWLLIVFVVAPNPLINDARNSEELGIDLMPLSLELELTLDVILAL